VECVRHWHGIEPDPPPPEPDVRGFYWSERGDYVQAVAVYEDAVRDDPENATALNNLAWLLSTCPDGTFRDGKRAVDLATRACTLTGRKSPECVDTLAAAFAESGNFQAAVAAEREAIGLFSRGQPSEMEYRMRLESYQASKPYRKLANQAK
jgi:tetratricopeptide (TPR) repeat protein